MSLVGTLAKVAIGVAIAKGVGGMMQQGSAGTARSAGGAGTGGLFGAGSAPRTANAGSGGGLEDIMKSVLGGSSGGTAAGGAAAGGAAAGGAMGGLGGLLEQLAGAGGTGGAAQGGIGGMLEQLTGGKTGGTGGGLGDLLGQLTGQTGGTTRTAGATGAGGLGDLLGGLLGGAAAGGAASNGKSFGEILNASLQNGGEPPVPPTPHQEAAAALLLRAMIQAAKCDGTIDAAEKAKIMQNLQDATPAEMKVVNALVAAPVDVQGLVRDVPKGLEAQVYTMSVMAIDLDNQTEANYLDDLANGLGISQRQVNTIHAQLGVPALYA